MQPDARPLDRCLESVNGPLSALVQRAERIAEVNRALRSWTTEPWVDAIRLVNIRGDTAVFFASSAAALVPLRYRREALLAFLREHAHLDCSKIEMKVKPTRHTFSGV